jgi:hypothetical protein
MELARNDFIKDLTVNVFFLDDELSKMEKS